MPKRNLLYFTGGLLILAVLITACGSSQLYKGDPQTGISVQYHFAPENSLQYRHSTITEMSMEMMDRSMDMITDQGILASYTGSGKNDEGDYEVEVRLDSLNINMKGMRGDQSFDVSELLGKIFTMIISPMGEVNGYQGTDSLTVDLGQMSGGEQQISSRFNSIFTKLPDRPVKIGESWTSAEIDTIKNMGMNMIMDSEVTSVFEGIEMVNGYECMKILAKAAGYIDGEGTAQGQNMAVEGDTETESTYYFAFREGMLVKSATTSFMEGTIAMSGQTSMTIPMVNETTITTELVK